MGKFLLSPHYTKPLELLRLLVFLLPLLLLNKTFLLLTFLIFQGKCVYPVT